MPFYAVAKGRRRGIYRSWEECQAQISGFSGSIFKKFDSRYEAESFVRALDSLSLTPNPITQPNIHVQSPKKTLGIDYYVYTDGACSNNGQPNATAGIGVYFGEGDPRNISMKLPSTEKQTNNVAELEAILYAYEAIEGDILNGKSIALVSDSEYSIRCLTTYGKRCDNEMWVKDIPNKELVKKVYTTYKGKGVHYMHVMAHTGKTDVHSIGNDGADRLANQAIGLDSCPYGGGRL